MAFDDEIKEAVPREAPPTVTTEDTLWQAMRMMAASEMSSLLVRSKEELVGVITDMDILHSLDRKHDPERTQIGQIMTACQLILGKAAANPCVQLDRGQSVQSALEVMARSGMRHLIIAGENGGAPAVVSSLDLFRRAVASPGEPA